MVQHAADELDLQLLHILQISPRISWTSAGSILGLSVSATAARWARLRDEGLAWIAVYPTLSPSALVTAFIDVDCEPRHRRALIERLCRDPRVASVDETSTGRDLLLTVVTSSMPRMSSFLLNELSTADGVIRTNTRLATKMHAEGADWRLDALNRDQRAQAVASVPATRAGGPIGLDEYWPLVDALSRDARASVADLARMTDGNPATVRRHLAQILNSGAVRLRCQPAPGLTGRPIECSWLTRVAPAAVANSVAALRTLPQLRFCVSVTGDANLVFTTFSRGVGELSRFEERLGAVLPELKMVNTILHLRNHKRMGWLLQEDGQTTGEVIVPNPYFDPAESG